MRPFTFFLFWKTTSEPRSQYLKPVLCPKRALLATCGNPSRAASFEDSSAWTSDGPVVLLVVAEADPGTRARTLAKAAAARMSGRRHRMSASSYQRVDARRPRPGVVPL